MSTTNPFREALAAHLATGQTEGALPEGARWKVTRPDDFTTTIAIQLTQPAEYISFRLKQETPADKPQTLDSGRQEPPRSVFTCDPPFPPLPDPPERPGEP